MYEKAQLAFENYMKNYDLTNPLISLKYKHTYKVVELMSELQLTKSEESIIRLPKCGTNRGMWKISPRECGISTHYYKKRGPPLIYIRMSLKSFYLNIIK